MKTKSIQLLFIIFITIYILIGLFFIAFYFPYVGGFYSGGKLTAIQIIETCINWICSISAIVILVFGVKIAKNIKQEQFHKNNGALLLKSGQILLVGSAIFEISHFVFLFLNKNYSLEIMFLLLGMVGITISVSLIVVYSYYKHALEIKKENDEIV